MCSRTVTYPRLIIYFTPQRIAPLTLFAGRPCERRLLPSPNWGFISSCGAVLFPVSSFPFLPLSLPRVVGRDVRRCVGPQKSTTSFCGLPSQPPRRHAAAPPHRSHSREGRQFWQQLCREAPSGKGKNSDNGVALQ